MVLNLKASGRFASDEASVPSTTRDDRWMLHFRGDA